MIRGKTWRDASTVIGGFVGAFVAAWFTPPSLVGWQAGLVLFGGASLGAVAGLWLT